MHPLIAWKSYFHNSIEIQERSRRQDFSYFVCTFFSEKDKKKTFSVSFYRVIETFVKFWENLEKLWKYSPIGLCSHSISRSPQLPQVFLNSVETEIVFFLLNIILWDDENFRTKDINQWLIASSREEDKDDNYRSVDIVLQFWPSLYQSTLRPRERGM